jgi:hypothetical protein
VRAKAVVTSADFSEASLRLEVCAVEKFLEA